MNCEKCVMILDQELPSGLLANTAAILGVTLGKLLPEVVGEDVYDASERKHLGIIEFPIPVLRAGRRRLSVLREQLAQPAYAGLTVVDFSDLAQSCKTYGDFIEKMARTPSDGLSYLGLAICGDRQTVTKLTGNLPLYR